MRKPRIQEEDQLPAFNIKTTALPLSLDSWSPYDNEVVAD